ncbi:hypothetical protein B9Z55_007020 [Caenorhabditis nigoni]|uniref:RING-type domain-containing protein n=1 Tax=Caenorhabditis nigoni TaxID=1611254 RepID=A0A2G5V7U7_9PELO|nr:hypothetical protein B9Z55_007020 [Caenorhabditis nigoni]
MQKYNEDFDFCMRHTNPENLKKLKNRRQGVILMMSQITKAQTSLLQDSNSIIEDSKRMETTFRIKKALEQEVYKRITACVRNNIPKATTSSKTEIPDNFQRILKRFYVMEDKCFRFMITMEGRKIPSIEDFMKLLTKPELVPVKFEKWTPELGEGIAHKIVYDEHYLKSPEELRRRLDEQASVLEEEEDEERKLEDSVTAIMNQFRKIKLQHLAVKLQLEKQQKVQSELDEIEKSMKKVQDLIREQFNTVQKECPVCYLEFTNGINKYGHTSCKACSRTIANNAKPNKPQCPVCRKNHTLRSFIPNFGLMPKPT